MRAADAPLPVTLIGGYLGAGKTTLVNRMLRAAGGLRLAVLVNDFGALPIDADLIESRNGNVIDISGGCVCCSYGSALMDALQDVAQMSPRPDHVLLETSGVALPGSVAAALTLLPDFALDAVVVLADAETVMAYGRDPYLGDTITRQLAAAHIVVLNKADLVVPQALAAAREWIAQHAPAAAILAARQADVPPELLFGAGRTRAAPPAAQRHAHATAQYTTLSFPCNGALDIAALQAGLADPALAILRAKGFLRDADGRLFALNAVASRVAITPFAASGEQPPGVVVIGLADSLDAPAVEKLFTSPR